MGALGEADAEAAVRVVKNPAAELSLVRRGLGNLENRRIHNTTFPPAPTALVLRNFCHDRNYRNLGVWQAVFGGAGALIQPGELCEKLRRTAAFRLHQRPPVGRVDFSDAWAFPGRHLSSNTESDLETNVVRTLMQPEGCGPSVSLIQHEARLRNTTMRFVLVPLLILLMPQQLAVLVNS